MQGHPILIEGMGPAGMALSKDLEHRKRDKLCFPFSFEIILW